MTGLPEPQVLVAGTAGGVGTTTVTALLFSAWSGRFGAPLLADHTGGTLGLRLSEGDTVGRLDDQALLVDVGAVAFLLGSELAAAAHRLVLVTGGTPIGCALAARCLDELRSEGGASVLTRTTVAVVNAFGRHRTGARLAALESGNPELAGLVVVPTDPALAAGGRIPLARLGRRTQTAVERLADLVGDGRTLPRVRVSG